MNNSRISGRFRQRFQVLPNSCSSLAVLLRFLLFLGTITLKTLLTRIPCILKALSHGNRHANISICSLLFFFALKLTCQVAIHSLPVMLTKSGSMAESMRSVLKT